MAPFWVAICQGDKGRLIVSDQYGGLYRFPIPKLVNSA